MPQMSLSAKVFQNPFYFVAFGFGTGLLPIAPGTWGTLAAIPLYFLLAPYGVCTYIFTVAILFALGVWICGKVSTDLGVHDYKGIVWDEVVGFLITVLLAPMHWSWLVTGFVLFRIFDVLKPWPIGWIDKHVNGGLGIMLDDVIAAIFAFILMQLLIYGVTVL